MKSYTNVKTLSLPCGWGDQLGGELGASFVAASLIATLGLEPRVQGQPAERSLWMLGSSPSMTAWGVASQLCLPLPIGRAPCRESVRPYVSISAVAGSINNTNTQPPSHHTPHPPNPHPPTTP